MLALAPAVAKPHKRAPVRSHGNYHPPSPDYWFGFLARAFAPRPQIIKVTIHQKAHRYRNTGTLTLRDPDTGSELGSWALVSGGAGRGAAPVTEYAIGEFIPGGTVGPRWNIRELGQEEDGDAWDPAIRDKRFALQLHRDLSGYTLGCIALVMDKTRWKAFVGLLNGLRERYGRLTFRVEPERDPTWDFGATAARSD
jgi:hypothetical protein